MFKSKKIFIVALILISMVAFTGCGSKNEAQPVEAQEEELIPIPVEVVAVTTADISSTDNVNGLLAANVEVNVVPKVPGKVAQILVDMGDRVNKGDVLVRLDDAELQAQLKQAQAGLAMAKTSGSQANVRYQDAKKNLERMQSLFEQGAISEQQLEGAEIQVELADPEVSAAQIKQSEASLQMVQTQLNNTVITAPVGGIISARNVEIGEMAGQTPVVSIVDIDKVIVEVNVTEGQVNKLAKGQKVDVEVAAVSDKLFAGTILSISPAADAQTRLFQVRIEISNKDHKLKPGMFAQVKLSTEKKFGVVVISKEAIIERDKEKIVFVVQNNVAIQKEVITGISDDNKVEVLSGLSSGEQLVIKGQHKLQNNAPVNVAGGNI